MRSASYRRTLAGLPALLIAGATLPGTASGSDLSSLISDLYGGDGLTLPNPDHQAHFQATGQEQLLDLNDVVSSGVLFSPFSSAATSIVFDIERGVPVRAKDSLGPLLLRRADTIGANRFSFGFSYTRVDYQQFEGDDLNDLELDLDHIDCCSAGTGLPPPDDQIGGGAAEFERDQIRLNLDLDIEQDIFAFYGTYGITNDWDVGAVAPVVRVDASVRSVAEIIDNSGTGDTFHFFLDEGTPDQTGIDSNDGEKTGLGDVILLSKYRILREEPAPLDAAVLGQITLPTGDEDDLLGTGETGFLGLLIGTKDLGRFSLHGNLGYELYTGSVNNSLRYGAGTDVRLFDGVTGVAEVLGRYEPNGDGTGDLVDGVVGAKWNPIGDLVLSSYFLTPINRDTGLRPDFIWGLGVEFGF